MVTSRVWVVKHKVEGVPKVDDFECIEEELPPCKQGDIIIEAEYLSVDPYMRNFIRRSAAGQTPPSNQVAKVIESCNSDYPVGSYVVAFPGWRSHAHLTADRIREDLVTLRFMKVPDVGKLARSAALGVFFRPGNSAYFGLVDICNPQPGETVLVNGAAGAVGSLVCQIAKIKGCRVIAFAGSEDKMAWLRELGVDHVFNYKTTDISQAIKLAAPEGVNCYFDNVGGDFSLAAVPHMATHGRIAICGAISTYNDESYDPLAPSIARSPYVETGILLKQLKVEGFIVGKFLPRWSEGINALRKWVEEGKLHYRESVTEGFENMPKAFVGLFKGDNIGKSVVHA